MEAAAELGVSPERVYELIFDGELIGEPDTEGVVRATPEALRSFAENRSTSAP